MTSRASAVRGFPSCLPISNCTHQPQQHGTVDYTVDHALSRYDLCLNSLSTYVFFFRIHGPTIMGKKRALRRVSGIWVCHQQIADAHWLGYVIKH